LVEWTNILLDIVMVFRGPILGIAFKDF